MKAYSEDLRKRIVEAVSRGMGNSEAARTFGLSLSSVKRYVGMAYEGGLSLRRSASRLTPQD
jgi:transposase